jgi:uncharacterized secreted repeat protein (TIGR03808 family)
MGTDRRRMFAALAGLGALGAASDARAAPAHDAAQRAELDAVSLGLCPNAPDDQSQILQRAIEQAAAARAILRLPPGFYRAGRVAAAKLCRDQRCCRGHAHRDDGRPVDDVGHRQRSCCRHGHRSRRRGNSAAGTPRAAACGARARDPIADCEIVNSGRNGVSLESVEGEVTANIISGGDAAIFSIDARGLKISGNTIRGPGNGGISVWRSAPGDDGTLIVDNRIDGVMNKAGGSGQWGNAINVFRADNVIVRGNRVRNAAFTAVRGNAASNLQIVGNTCSGLGEVALYAEFSFEGAVIANNIVDGAALGVSVTIFDKGGRLAVVQGNLIRNLVGRRPPGTDPNDSAGIGIGVEADTVVTGNVIENVPYAGIAAGWGAYLRDVAITSNVIRHAEFGITVSVVPGAGAAVIADNMISDIRSGAIVGMEWKKPVTGDLAKDGAARYAQLSIVGNRVR